MSSQYQKPMVIPEGFPALLKAFTREILRSQVCKTPGLARCLSIYACVSLARLCPLPQDAAYMNLHHHVHAMTCPASNLILILVAA